MLGKTYPELVLVANEAVDEKGCSAGLEFYIDRL